MLEGPHLTFSTTVKALRKARGFFKIPLWESWVCVGGVEVWGGTVVPEGLFLSFG